jgi:4-hydroxybenzoate-CoA ligase
MVAIADNAAVYFVDRNAEGPRADEPAFIEAAGRERTITYRELKRETGRAVDFLFRHGIEHEARIALLLLDQIEFPILFWGALKAGVHPVALNTLLSADVYRIIIGDCRARALVVSSELYATVAPLLSDLPHLKQVFVVGGEAPEGTIDFHEAFATCEARPTTPVSPDETAFWLYSSGSTGQPKGVRHVHSSLKYTADTYGAEVLGIREDDVVFSAAKFFFAYGLGNSMSFPMSVGACAVIYNGRPTPASVAGILDRFKPTVFCGVPTLYAALCAELEAGRIKFDAPLRRCPSAGEALPEDVGVRWRKLTGVDILDGVGSTEMLHIFLSNRPGDVVYGTSGVAVPGYDLRLVDEHDGDVPEGGIGELLVRGASAAQDYWNRRAQSRSTFRGHWTHTGDKYEKLPGGRYRYCGRTDDMFKVSGIWVSPFEVEAALIAHPAVLEAAVVPKHDSDGLEKPKAFVVLKSGEPTEALEAELKELVKQKIGKWKYPRWIAFAHELPKTATGKIQRFKLKED